MTDLSELFDPDRVAVVGATDRPGSVGRALMENLATFDGDVLPVNPNRETVFGETCYPEIGDVPDAASVDLAVVAVPASAAVEVVRQVGRAGVGSVVVVTAGFAEAGPAGERRERDLIAAAEEYDLDLVGPNCVGVIGTASGLNATFVPGTPEAGSVSLMSQSGAFVSAVLGWAAEHGVGFRNVVSLGNEAVLDETDVLAAWGDDPDTDVVMAYLEDVDDGQRFVRTAREVTATTPVVAVKSGRTAAGAAAAASHTGSLAGSDEAYRAGFEQAGVVRARTVQEAFDAGQALDGQPLPDRDDVAVVTNGGGPGVLAADRVGESRLRLADFPPAVADELAAGLPDGADASNPLDVVGDADVERFRRALDVVMGTDAVGAVVVICVPTMLFEFGELAEVVGDLHDRHGTPVVAALMGGAEADRAAETLEARGIPNYFDPARAVGALETLAEYREIADREYGPPMTFDVDRERAREVLATATGGATEGGAGYLGAEAMALLDAYGVPTPAGDVAESAAEAEAIAAGVGAPVVMKLLSPDIPHKSDVGGVAVGVPADEVRETYGTLLERAADHDPDATVRGVRVEEVVDPADGTETIVGAKRDPQFGHLLMFGLGGIFVQVFEDTTYRVAPVSEREAREMTAEIGAAPMLRGARGRAPADLDAVVETIGRVSQLVTDFPAIAELDVNPLVAAPDGVCALDLRLTVDREAFGDGSGA